MNSMRLAKRLALLCPLVVLDACALDTSIIRDMDDVHTADGASGDALVTDGRTGDTVTVTDSVTVDAGSDVVTAPDAACVPSLSNVGTGDFTVSMTVTTRASTLSTIACQRSVCNGNNPLWEVLMDPGGTLAIAVDDDAGHLCQFHSSTIINDDASHNIVITRRHAQLAVNIDGADAGSVPCATSVGLLPAMTILSGDPCEHITSLVPLVGTVTNVCLLRR